MLTIENAVTFCGLPSSKIWKSLGLQAGDELASLVEDPRVDLDVVDFRAEGDRRLLRRLAAAPAPCSVTSDSRERGRAERSNRLVIRSSHTSVQWLPAASIIGRRRARPWFVRRYNRLNMPLDIGAVQKALKADGLDAWLLYDFHGSNPVSYRLAGMGGAGHLATRRWFYLIPQSGEPHALVHAIERYNLDHLPGSKTVYAGREQLHAGLATLLTGVKRVAMEYSPNCAIPYVSRVDAGTIELIRSLGVDVVSSGDLIQQFEARWNDAAIATHRTRIRKAVSHQGPGVRGSRAAAARRRRRPPSTTFSRRWSAGSRTKA